MTTFAAKAKTAEKDSAKSHGAKSHSDNLPMTQSAFFGDFPIQRKASCACGGGCPSCQSKSSNLTISHPNDASEIEADQVADRVMRMEMPKSLDYSSPEKTLQRKKISNSPISGAPSAVQEAINFSEGKSLDKNTRDFMESRFNYDFGNVKIHDNELAAKSADSVNALAYTSGKNIVFNSGQYNTNSDSGKRLLAHELAHVLQQEKAGFSAQQKIQRKPAQSPGATDDVPVNPVRDKKLPFRFRTDEDIPAAIKGAANAPVAVWWIEKAFNLEKATAERIVSLVNWQPDGYIRATKKGEFVKFNLSISGIVATLKILSGEGRIDAKAVEKFEAIIALQEKMNPRDYQFFRATKKDVFTDLNVDGFTVDNLGKFETEIFTFLRDKESILGSLGLLDDYYRAEDITRELDFQALKDRLFDKKFDELTDADKEEVLSLFRNKVMRRVFLMLDKSNTIAREELKRYTLNKQDLANLITLLTGQYGASYSEADELRVKGIYKFLNEYNPNYRSVPGGKMTDNFRQILKYAAMGETELLKRISQIPAANIDFQIANFFIHQIMRSGSGATWEEAKQTAQSEVYSKYPEFVEANRKDAVTEEGLKKSPAKDFPILYDLSLDFRVLSRLPRAELETKILEELEDKEEKSAETQRYLLKEPWLIWEFEPLLRGVMAEEGLSKDDAVGKVINDKIEDVKDHKFWRSIALGAIGLALGIAGFFTGGATWAGIALITGSVIVNLIDLNYELKDYALHAAASEATFEGGLTHSPSSIGIIFAIGGLVLDFLDVLKIIKPLAKPLTTVDDVAAYSEEIFKQLEAAGKLPKGATKDSFVKTIVENWQKREGMMKSLPDDVKALLAGDSFKALHQGVQEGLFKVFDASPEAFTHLVKSFAKNPEILTRLGAQTMLDPKATNGIADLFRFTQEAGLKNADDIFRFYGSIGSNALSGLPDVLAILRRGNIPSANPELAKLILTNRNLQQSLLRHSSNPDVLLRHWEQYQLKLANLPPDGAKLDFVKYLDEQPMTGTKLADTSAGVPQKIEFRFEDIKFPPQLTGKDLKQVKGIIQKLVNEKGFISAEQMQAIIRVAQSADLAGSMSRHLQGFLNQLNNAYGRILKGGMKPDNVSALLRGLENTDEISAALKLLDRLNTGADGLKVVDTILSSVKISDLSNLLMLEGKAFKLGDVNAIVSKMKIASKADSEIFELALLAGEASGKSSDLTRLRQIVESLDEGQHSVDVIKAAIKEADVFEQKLAKALTQSGTGLEDTARLVWGKGGVSLVDGKIKVPSKFRKPLEEGMEGSGSNAYKAVLGNPEKAQKLVDSVMSGKEIDPVKWTILRKTIDDANIDQAIKNAITGELWAKASIKSYEAKGYKLFKREVPIMYKTPAMSKATTAKADAVLMKGDEILILEFKSGKAEFSKAQEVIYPLIKDGKWEHLTIKNPELEKLLRANPDKVKFLEVREPYNP